MSSPNDKEMLRDARGVIIPQVWNPNYENGDGDMGNYEALEGADGAYNAQAIQTVVAGFFTGLTSITKVLDEEMNGISIFNNGTDMMTFTVNDETRPVLPKASYTAIFKKTFTEIIIVATGEYFIDLLQQLGASMPVVVVPPVDTTVPNEVTNLAESNVTQTSVTLSWSASTSQDVASYEVWRAGSLLATVTGTTYDATGMSAATQYTFTVKAKDATGNVSTGVSRVVTTAAQPADTTPPANVTGLTSSNPTSSGVTLTWLASSSGDIKDYRIYNGSTLLATVTDLTYGVTGLMASTAYSLIVKARDTSNNEASGVSVDITTVAPSDVTAPIITATPNGGTFTSAQSVTLSSNESNTTIFYTTNGSTPNVSSSTYSTPIPIPATGALKFFGKDLAGNVSAVQTVNFTINLPDSTAPDPVTGLTAGTPSSNGISLSWTASGSTDKAKHEVAFSTDGTNFTVASAAVAAGATSYSITGLTPGTAYTLRVVVIDTSDNRSTTATTTATTAAPDTTAPGAVTSLAAGTATASTIPLSWVLSPAGDVATQEVAYSIDGTNFTIASGAVNTSSYSYTVTGLTASTNYTLRVVAIDGAGNRSTAATITASTIADVADVIAPTVTASPVAGTYGSAQSVTLTPSETATIRFTIDGSLPNGSSPIYSEAIAISVPTIIKYFAEDAAGNKSPIYQDRYIVGTVTDAVIPTLTATPANGTYNTDQVLTVTANEPAIIYYTSHATTPPTPTAASTKYTGPINVNASQSYSFIAIDASGNQSAVLSKTFTIDKSTPIAPTNFAATTKRGTSMVLSWTASASPDANAYLIYDSNDFLLGTVTGTTFEVIGLVENTEYTFKLKARDAAQNLSTVVTVTDSTITSAFTATGYVNDASLLLLTEGPINLASFFNPNRFFNSNEKFTLVFTVNTPVNTALLTRWLFGQDANSRVNLTKATSGQLAFKLYGINTSNSSSAVPAVDTGVTNYTDAVLHHIVIVRNNPLLQIYVDDVKVGEGVNQAGDNLSTNASTLPMYLGAAGKTITFKNVAYYNRALTALELTQNYNALK